MTQKRILMLGGSPFQVPAIRMARELGHHVITCDYLPENPGHRFAHEYHNVSTTDLEAVLALATQLKIDGIVAYASDPAAPTAAYVAEKLGLPGNPFEAVLTLARKDRYRKFLSTHGFATPRAQGVTTLEEARATVAGMQLPVVVKPVDSSGSRGVTVLRVSEDLPQAWEHALAFSRAQAAIIEEYVEMEGFQIAGDGFLVDGKLAFRCFANEHFDYTANALVPIGESFPSILLAATQDRIHTEIQRLMTALGMRQGALNFDIRLGTDGRIHLMEVGPRNGGNLIPDVTRFATGVDMIRLTIQAALGEDCSQLTLQPAVGWWASYIIHALQDGELESITIAEAFRVNVVQSDLLVKPGDNVKRFDGSHCTLGTAILRFGSEAEMLEAMAHMNERIRVQVKSP